MKSILKAVKHRIKVRFPNEWDYLAYLKWRSWCLIQYFKWNVGSFCTIRERRKNFLFQGREIKYFNHWYNNTYLNERTVEIPIIYDLVRRYKDKNMLEIGNVLSHYFTADWDIVDKYEKAKRVINEDIMDFKPQKKYDFIVSVSTFEHIGRDEECKDDNKAVDAIRHVKDNFLTAGGIFIMTVPIGCNSAIDKKLLSGESGFDKIYYLKRTSADNRWQECKIEDALTAKYNSPYKWANVIAICSTAGS